MNFSKTRQMCHMMRFLFEKYNPQVIFIIAGLRIRYLYIASPLREYVNVKIVTKSKET